MSPVRHRYVRDTSEAKSAKAPAYGAAEFVAMADAFGRVPPELRRRLGHRLRPLGERSLAAARANAAAWSTRIPGAISLQIRFAGKNPGLIITVDHKAAPHGRPLEGILTNVFRHPVFGDTDTWVAQDARPYVWPAIEATQQDIAGEVDAAIDETFAEAGFR